MTLRKPFVLTIAIAACSAANAGGAAPGDVPRQVRSLLSEKCFACHGPDAASRQAGLRLDSREGLLQMREGRPPVVPGRPDESELLRRITARDAQERMPPAS